VADYLSFAHALDEDGLAIQQSDIAVLLSMSQFFFSRENVEQQGGGL
jgi:hypothetical protein